MTEVEITKNDAGQRLDKYLQKTFPLLAKGKMHKAIRTKKIKVNRKRAQFDQKLEEGDRLQLFLPEELLSGKKKVLQPVRPLKVLFENEDYLVMDKPAGLLSQKDQPQDQDTLNDRLLSYLNQAGIYDPEKIGSFTPSIGHRLDRNTSGIVLAAKNAAGARTLAKAIRENQLKKTYLGVVEGKPENGKRAVWIKKEGTKALVSDVQKEGYLPARMEVKTLTAHNGLSLVSFELETGRFHQIRATMAHEGHPLAGDFKYGSQLSPGYLLHAYKVGDPQAVLDLPEIISYPQWNEPEWVKKELGRIKKKPE